MMRSIVTFSAYLFAVTLGTVIISAQEEKTTLRSVFQDSNAVLQSWRGTQGAQEYLLSGRKPGLNVGLTFDGDTPNEAKISIGPGRSLSVQSAGDRKIISLFEGSASDISLTYDLDANGTWDARISRSGKCEISFEGAWHQVAESDGLVTGIPHARIGGIEYEFSAGEWKPRSNTTPQ